LGASSSHQRVRGPRVLGDGSHMAPKQSASTASKKVGHKADVSSSRKQINTGMYAGKRLGGMAPKWHVTDYKPPRKISDKELEMARKMFFELDRDGSGSIDAEELGMMLRSLGQNPTEDELAALIDSVDGGDDNDKDGQIQLREFLKLYTEGLDTKSKGRAGKEDVANVFSALGGDTNNKDDRVSKDALTGMLMEFYNLEVDPDTIMTKAADGITRADLEGFLMDPEP